MSKQPLIDRLDQAIGRMLASPEGIAPSIDSEVAALLDIARELRDLPAPDFRATLKANLERQATEMSTKTDVSRPVFHTLTSYLVSRPEFIDFLKRVFGAEETFRGEVIPGRLLVEVRIGDSMLMISVGEDNVPTVLEVHVPNVDEVYQRAMDAGCVELQPVEDAHWEPIRLGVVQDLAGNLWSIVTDLGTSPIPEGRHSLSAGFILKDAAGYVEFLKQAFGATELRRYEWPGGFYASVRIGDSVAGVSEAANHEWMRPMKTMINMHVPDCDAVHAQAVRTGAKSTTPVADQPYGIRGGGIEDPWGNPWFIVKSV